jgi:acetylornithine deacetylase/succinyl-diaminopimelate desuccinylase family protein
MQDAVDIARKLVSIPSVNPMGKGLTGERYTEKKMAGFIREFLSSIGVESELFGEDPDRPNLVARIDVGAASTVMLEAHMDTVSEENMSVDPFDPIIRDGKLYGRGSCDTKASLATYLHAIQKILSEKRKLKYNVILAFVKDEEYSFSGARELVAKGIKADFAIVGEPTELNLIYAHKGLCRFFIHTEGRSCHASMPWNGVNAIHKMSNILNGIEAYADSLKAVQHPSLGQATINVGRISGGQTVNTVPASCTIEVDNRLLPGMTAETILEKLKPFLGDPTTYRIDPPYLLAMGVENAPDATHCLALKHACELEGIQPELQTAHYATDAAIYQEAGIPCVVFGPGSIQQAHTADEHIEISQISRAADIILRLLTEEN